MLICFVVPGFSVYGALAKCRHVCLKAPEAAAMLKLSKSGGDQCLGGRGTSWEPTIQRAILSKGLLEK